jgi:hypothetical protein
MSARVESGRSRPYGGRSRGPVSSRAFGDPEIARVAACVVIGSNPSERRSVPRLHGAAGAMLAGWPRLPPSHVGSVGYRSPSSSADSSSLRAWLSYPSASESSSAPARGQVPRTRLAHPLYIAARSRSCWPPLYGSRDVTPRLFIRPDHSPASISESLTCSRTSRTARQGQVPSGSKAGPDSARPISRAPARDRLSA